jgi:putative ABC transport system permease protein
VKTPLRLFLFLLAESFVFAIQALRVNKLRTILSLLGITIGIFAIISVYTVTDTMEKKVRSDVASLGNNVIYVQKWPWVPEENGEYPWWKYMNRPVAGIKEMDELQKKMSTAEAMTYVATVDNQTIKYRSSSAENCEIICASQDYDKVRSFTLHEGRFFNDYESYNGRPVAVIGSDVTEALFTDGNALGKVINVRGSKLTVIGTIEKEGSSLVGNSSDNCVIIPVNYARSLINLRSDQMDPYIMIKSHENISTAEMKDELLGTMRGIRKLNPKESNDFALNETSLLSNGLEAVFSIISIAAGFIGGFSILVGGFGIANIMFVSVRERTHIIGIQKSLGSKNYFILLQFLFEAIVLCIIGGIIGLILVFILSIIASLVADYHFILSVANIIWGLGISTAIGIVSGIVPAYRAGKMNPVDAIRTS